jgi:asparagine synthase (glutamine-hydrolysing)
MCGIAGALGPATDATLEAARKISASLVHRGPDASGEWVSPVRHERVVALGHRRLSILDTDARADQPMVDPERGHVLVFNGELYNYRELRKELQSGGAQFRTESDTEVLLRAYGRWGEGCLERLRGMFAFGLWDEERGELLLARDRLGIKPLYIAEVTLPQGVQTVLFASEVRALLATGLLRRKLDAMGLATYHWQGFVSGPQTILRGVRLLPPGSSTIVRLADFQIRQRRWWSLPEASGEVDDPAELAETLTKAVSQHLASDVPLGVFLSGGVDSSAVASLAVRASSAPVKTFNVAFDEAEYDESPHARAVAEALGTEHVEVRLSAAEFRDSLSTGLEGLDQPTFDALNTWVVSRAVREAGVTVALAGTGGDELFGGYSSFAELPSVVRKSRLAAAVPTGVARRLAGAVTRAKTGAPGAVPPQTRWGKLGDALATRGSLIELYQVAYGLFSEEFVRELTDADRVPPIRLGLTRERRAELEALTQGQPVLHAISLLETATFLTERLLRDTDAASMNVSLEVRVPLVDHEVVEAAARLNDARRFHPLGRKQVLRDIALSSLEESLFERPKAGFELPIDRWCRSDLREEVGGVLMDIHACEAVGLQHEAVASLWRAFESGAPGIYWSRVWSLYVLMRWAASHNLRV